MIAALDTLQLLKQRLETVRVDGEPAFGSVRLFDAIEIDQASQQLYVYDGRLAVIVHRGADYSPRLSGQRIDLARALQLLILLSARRYADRPAALYGGQDEPGLLALADAVTAAVVGDLGNGAVAILDGGEVAEISPDSRNREPGRLVYQLRCQLITDTASFYLRHTSWRPAAIMP